MVMREVKALNVSAEETRKKNFHCLNRTGYWVHRHASSNTDQMPGLMELKFFA